MGDYTGWKKEQLRDLCLTRKLPVSGTNEELIARLQGWDDAHPDAEEPDLLAEIDVSEAVVGTPPDPEPVVPSTPVPTPNPYDEPLGEGEAKANQTVYRAQFEVPGDHHAVIPTDLSQQFAQQTERMAILGGYRIRGGAARVGFKIEDGKRYAIYEVILGKRLEEVG